MCPLFRSGKHGSVQIEGVCLSPMEDVDMNHLSMGELHLRLQGRQRDDALDAVSLEIPSLANTSDPEQTTEQIDSDAFLLQRRSLYGVAKEKTEELTLILRTSTWYGALVCICRNFCFAAVADVGGTIRNDAKPIASRCDNCASSSSTYIYHPPHSPPDSPSSPTTTG